MSRLLAIQISIIAGVLMGTCAANAEELNVRMMPNNVSNQISHMRLQALLSKDANKQDPLGSQKNYGSVFGDDCNLNVGNSTGGQSLLSKPQTIIITGPVVNKCR